MFEIQTGKSPEIHGLSHPSSPAVALFGTAPPGISLKLQDIYYIIDKLRAAYYLRKKGGLTFWRNIYEPADKSHEGRVR